ncbi:energy-coupling factor ABC transporter substrate-binding protein [Metaclostridioides mangenotii]|uniref:Cobalt transport protein CbiN n=1 Tax=Metaclostridioides mangenotii TaxID=1540 RepID=A0ABS4EBM2_9FIRM|nr:energy-coupling factor ABC transporter substrate-binding protein [Clostridioides mangenotii]MBP1855340.1 cobalt/nickel transport protein [Clostridioides mangenotii]
MSTKFKSKKKTNLILLVLVVLIAVVPLLFNSGAEFGGADGEAEGLITEINPDYEPWFGSLYKPASGEIESLLFSVQAALGAGVIGYFLGKRKRD